MNELMTREPPGFLERALYDPNVNMDKLAQLIAMDERVQDRRAKREFNEAMNALQKVMPIITKDKKNTHTNTRYVSYETIDRELRPLYTAHGFSVTFTTHAEKNRIKVACRVHHIGGHDETDHELESGPDMTGSKGTATKTEVQGVGSIVTYLKRYTLQAAFAVSVQDDETDDDGVRGRVQRPNDPPRRTIAQWLDEFETRVLSISTRHELDAYLSTREVGAMSRILSGQAMERYNLIAREAMERLDAPPADEPDGEQDQADE